MSRRNRSQQSRERTEQERERDREERSRRRAAREAALQGDTTGFEPPAGEPAGVLPEPDELLPPAPGPAGTPYAGAAPGPADIPARRLEPSPPETPSADAVSGSPEMPSADVEPGPSPIPPAGLGPGAPETPTPPAEPPPAELSSAAHSAAALPITESHAAEPSAGAVGALGQGEHSPAEIPDEDPPAAARTAAVSPASGNPDSSAPPVGREPGEASSASSPAGDKRGLLRPRKRSPTRRRSLLARAGAVLALAGVIAAVWLLIESLGGSGHARPAGGAAVVRVVIPEGETRLQIARIAAGHGLTGSYRAASKSSPLLNPARYGAPGGTPDLEGFLFPATYELSAGAPVTQLVEEQLVAFKRAFGAGMIARAKHLHTTAYRVLIIASMIEREAKTARDRPLIAAVIYNRLNKGIPLGIDATIYYALALRDGIAAYSRELSEAQLHIASPYNTRVHAGLPPTPISNPGTASIEATAHPAHVPYLYYVLAADGCGEHVFSTTYAQFERNAAAYRAAVTKNGGQPPACKAK